jgi:arsenite oxidase small subunit
MFEDEEFDEQRRKFLKIIGMASGIFVLGGVGSFLKIVEGPLKIPPWPKTRITNFADLEINKPLIFYYPLKKTPNIIVKLESEVEGGVGPNNNVVAFSQICQHQGCFVSFSSDGTATCPCHQAIYDLRDKAKVLGGPSQYQLPSVKLEYDLITEDIYAVGMEPPVVFGYGQPGSDDVDILLVGGELVSE